MDKAISTSTNDRILLSRFRAAELLSVSLQFLGSAIRRGKLTPVRLGRRVLFQRAELERFAAEGIQPVRR